MRFAILLFADCSGWMPSSARSDFDTMSVVGTVIYFPFFLLMPWYSRIDSHKPEPARVTS